MTRRIEISTAIRAVIEKFLIAHDFSRYSELSSLLRDSYGVRVSKSWLHEHSQTFRREYQAAERLAIRARAIVAAGIGEGSSLFNRSLELLAAELDAKAAASSKTKTRGRNRRRVAA